MQQDQRLTVGELASARKASEVIKRQFVYLNALVLVVGSSASRGPIGQLIGGEVTVAARLRSAGLQTTAPGYSRSRSRAQFDTRSLWLRADSQLRVIVHTHDVIDKQVDGLSQQEALDELCRLKERTPPVLEVYKNGYRFDEEAGVPGSGIKSNSRAAVDAAKTTVAFIASLIAMRQRL